MIEPEGLGLACTKRTRITFACGYGDSATVCLVIPIWMVVLSIIGAVGFVQELQVSD